MATYGEKVKKYEAIVKKAIELGLEPEKRDLKKLYYYVGRVQKKGADHKTKLADKLGWLAVDIGKIAKDVVIRMAVAVLTQK